MKSKNPEKPGRFNWSIKWKLMAFITILVFSLVAILSYAQISNQKRILESGLENRIALMKANLIERGKGHIVNLSQVIENDLAAFDLSGVMSALEESVANNQEIQYAILVNAEGVVFADTHRPELTQTRLTGENDLKALACRSITAFRYHDGQGPVIEITSPVQISTEPWGVLRLIYTLRFLEAEIESSQKQIKQEINRMIYSSMATSLGFLVACLFIVFFLSSKFSKPLIQLTESAKKLAKGNFSVSSDIQINSHDELGVLGSSFIEMSKDLEDSYRKLEEYSNRYHGLFEYSPISLWEEDLS
ncbi:MAG: HAMP domain-containing protein [Deltaproteobacteria bacterium]|nr:HAMP domain-containing protein [Deltaproteobacteria bacterium]